MYLTDIPQKEVIMNLRKIKNWIFTVYWNTISSIAFYPTIIAVALLLLALLLTSVEDNEMTKFLLENASYLVINNADTARAILTTLIGGIISLTVFSFSMVMVLLSQASNNFSPRLLPGLISDKRNQIVLGFYLGSIVYNIIVLIGILPSGDSYTLDGFSVLVGIILGVGCLGLFVFFIHSISTGIQINNILEKIFTNTKERLERLASEDRQQNDLKNRDIDDWYQIQSNKAGYFRGMNMSGLKEVAEECNCDFIVEAYEGKYLLPNMCILKCSRDMSQEESESVTSLVIYSNSDNVSNNYVLGIRQIAEVGIKAMSPGINDPGTAVMTVDYLTELFALRMQLDEKEVYETENKKKIIELRSVSFENLIYHTLAAYRQYCKHDIILMEKLTYMLKYLYTHDAVISSYKNSINNQLEIIKEDIQESISNKSDRKKLEMLVDSTLELA